MCMKIMVRYNRRSACSIKQVKISNVMIVTCLIEIEMVRQVGVANSPLTYYSPFFYFSEKTYLQILQLENLVALCVMIKIINYIGQNSSNIELVDKNHNNNVGI